MIIAWILIPYSGGPTLCEYGRLETMKGDWIPMKLRRILSSMMALLLVCSLPLAAFADTYDIANGSIEISASADKQTVTQNGNTVDDDAPVITGTTTKNTVTIMAGMGAEANVTLSGVNIDVGGTGSTYPEPFSGEAAVRIRGKGDVTIELDGENTVQSGVFRAGVEKNDADSSGKLTITDETGTDGSLEATGGYLGSGIGGGSMGSGSDITITGSAEVTAQGGFDGAGIGGGSMGSGSDITSRGSAQVEATGGKYASGIGGGYNYNGNGTGSNITVSGDAQVKAQGGIGYYSNLADVSHGAGAAIGDGGGYITGNHLEDVKGKDAVVTTDALEEGKSYGLYVGELDKGWVATYEPDKNMDTANPGSLTYKGASNVTGAQPIGKLEPTCTKDGHRAGFTVNGTQVGGQTLPATGHSMGKYYTTKEATCQEAGEERSDCENCNYYETRPLKKVDHSYGDFASDNNATCTSDGTKTRKCIWCGLEDTVPDLGTMKEHTFTTYKPDPNNPATCTEAGTKTAVCDVCKNATHTIPDPAKNHSMGDFSTYKEATCTEAGEERAYCKNKCGHYETKDIPPQGHSFTKYISDGNATYTSDGTKTAKCDHCDATDTLPDPGSKLVFLPGEYYKVIGKDGKALVCKETNQNGVLTITAEEDFATLTGSLSGMKTLKAHGIDTIVFITKDATSTFAIEDLLAQGASGDSYQLTHDGSTVTFTLGDGTDIRKILK